VVIDFDGAQRDFSPANIAKWMTLPVHSGNMSQLYRGFTWISMMASLAGATAVASVLSQFDPFTRQFASP